MQTQEIEQTTRTMRLTGALGHVEITWDSKDDSAIRALIEKKRSEGVRFYLIKTTGAFFKTKKLKDIGQLERRRINVHDSDIDQLAEDGVVKLIPIGSGDNEFHIIPGEPSAEQIASGNSVALVQNKGG